MLQGKILIIAAVFPPEPVVSANRTFSLAKELSKKAEILVISPRPTRPFGYDFKAVTEAFPFRRIVLSSFTYPKSRLLGRFRESYSFGRNVIKFIRQEKDVLRCVYVSSWPLFAQKMIVRECKRKHIPAVMSVQDIYPEALVEKLPMFKRWFHQILLPIDKYSLGNASGLVTISNTMKEYLVSTRNLSSSKVHVVSNWSQAEASQRAFISGPDKSRGDLFTFMFLGSLSPTAGVAHLIKSYGLHPLKGSRLLIAGSGSEKEALISLAQKYSSALIEFWEVEPEQVPEIQSLADVALLSLKKGASFFAIPSKLNSYLFSRKPVIACVDQGSDTARIISEAKCGWVLPPEDESMLHQIMAKVIRHSEADLRQMGENGYLYADQHFSQKKNLKQLVDLVLHYSGDSIAV